MSDYPTIRPRLLLDFANSKKLDRRITFRRSSIGTYVGVDGLIKTAGIDEPRFDHDPVTGVCKGLLVEESRTNLATYSEQFDNAAWGKTTQGNGIAPVVTPNAATAPDGLYSADLILFNPNGSTNLDRSTIRRTFTPAASTQYTISVWLRADFSVPVTLFLNVSASGAGGSAGTLNITVTSTWTRYSVTGTTGVTGGSVAFELRASGDFRSTPFTLSAWGGQFETGAFPTSYIPTTASTVTRSADSALITGTDFSRFFAQNTGTIYADCSIQSPASAGQAPIVSVYPAASVASFRMLSRRVNSGARSTSNTDLIDVTGSLWNGERKKIAATWVPNDCALADNGTLVGIDKATASPLTVVDTMDIGAIGGASGSLVALGGWISRIAYWPKRLPDSQLQALTRR